MGFLVQKIQLALGTEIFARTYERKSKIYCNGFCKPAGITGP